LKVLLVAYACEPEKGSEPGVGWNWAINLSKFVEITVITRTNNKPLIKKILANKSSLNLTFIYYDIPVFCKMKKIIPFGVQLYSFIWEYFVINRITKLDVDIVQRVTFVSTFSILRLYKINKPYIMSFCAGGEITPANIYLYYSFFEKLKEKIRLFYNSAYKYCSVTKKLYENSKIVLAVTSETKEFICNFGYKKKIIIEPAIGLGNAVSNLKPAKNYRMIYAGSFIYWKNMEIMVKAFGKINNNNYELDIYGEENGEAKIKKLILQNMLQNRIHFKGSISHAKLQEKMPSYDLALHASSHDSGSMFLLEAISAGVPVLFLDTGGPKEIFSGLNYPLKVDPSLNYSKIIILYAKKIEWFYENYDQFMGEFNKYRIDIIQKYDWQNKARRMLAIYKEILNENSPST